MAARKIVRVQQKWPNELFLMSGLKKKETQIKRCMVHIFEFYEETFPEDSLTTMQRQGTSDKSVASRNERHHTRENKKDRSEMTTPTDIETPAKKSIERRVPRILLSNGLTGEKTSNDSRPKKSVGNLLSGLYYAHVN